jgi:hypothetical protein
MSKYISFTKLKHLIFLIGVSTYHRKEAMPYCHPAKCHPLPHLKHMNFPVRRDPVFDICVRLFLAELELEQYLAI